ncbi:kinase-like protein [Trametes versicolor FP-101664 SS1]|uniref:kinase-like protein n=1 Tax=Trametes versicolor (strain FP-101664) TaxID=717944 RepID=UPI0004622AE6|nr:kinase-like protein [Trametes versicolor FP-101664 SS1]EIW54037.1 kinase-like protein [Trametes versicolor FP-101664 SS1]
MFPVLRICRGTTSVQYYSESAGGLLRTVIHTNSPNSDVQEFILSSLVTESSSAEVSSEQVLATHPGPKRPSTVERSDIVRSDDDTIIGAPFVCHFPSQPLLTSRLCHVFIEDNRDLPDALESKIVHWNVDLDDENADLEEYHAALAHLVEDHIIPRLTDLPPSSLLFAPRDPTFIASTVERADGRVIRLRAGLPDSLQEIEAACLRRIKNHAATRLESVVDFPVHDIGRVLVLNPLDAWSRSIARVLLPDQTIGVMQWIPTASALLSPGFTAVMEAGTLREMELLRTIPPHPHIIGPPIAYISREFGGATLICGFVSKFLPGGNLWEVLEAGPVALPRRIKWAYQATTALVHVHHTAHTYHGDVKLENIMLDGNDYAILIDFEQGRANEEAAAPEVHAGGSVTELLRHRAYPYDEWLHVPRAIEAAEVHALGVALSKLFEEDEVPSDIVQKCKAGDPNERPTLKTIYQYFDYWHASKTATK